LKVGNGQTKGTVFFQRDLSKMQVSKVGFLNIGRETARVLCFVLW
jgi:hypothetical protein